MYICTIVVLLTGVAAAKPAHEYNYWVYFINPSHNYKYFAPDSRPHPIQPAIQKESLFDTQKQKDTEDKFLQTNEEYAKKEKETVRQLEDVTNRIEGNSENSSMNTANNQNKHILINPVHSDNVKHSKHSFNSEVADKHLVVKVNSNQPIVNKTNVSKFPESKFNNNTEYRNEGKSNASDSLTNRNDKNVMSIRRIHPDSDGNKVENATTEEQWIWGMAESTTPDDIDLTDRFGLDASKLCVPPKKLVRNQCLDALVLSRD